MLKSQAVAEKTAKKTLGGYFFAAPCSTDDLTSYVNKEMGVSSWNFFCCFYLL